MPSNKEELGLTHGDYKKRFEQAVDDVAAPTKEPFQLLRSGFAALANLMIQLGIPYPLSVLFANPFRLNFRRDGILLIAPNSSVDVTFAARKKGMLVLDMMEVVRENPTAQFKVTLKYKFGNIQNIPNFVCTAGESKGIWNYEKCVLFDEACLTITITNTALCSQAVVSLNMHGWEL